MALLRMVGRHHRDIVLRRQQSIAFLHDARSLTLTDAIRRHKGEAEE